MTLGFVEKLLVSERNEEGESYLYRRMVADAMSDGMWGSSMAM